MKQAYLVRQTASSHGTFGIMLVPGMTPLRTGELPYLNNAPNISSIPVGQYTVRWSKSPKFGWVYHIRNVKGRSHILIHAGNYCGNTSMGLKSDVLGCTVLGTRKGWLGSQKVVLASRVAVRRFSEFMNREPFKLMIIDGVNIL